MTNVAVRSRTEDRTDLWVWQRGMKLTFSRAFQVQWWVKPELENGGEELRTNTDDPSGVLPYRETENWDSYGGARGNERF